MAAISETRALLKAFRRIARAFDIQSRRIDREVGLTIPQLVVLTCIGEMGEVTSRAISAQADLSPPTVVGILDKLEAKGLIDRYRSARDRRIVHARLTPQGAEALAKAPPPLGERFEREFAAMAPGEQRALVADLDRLAALLLQGETETEAQ
jgi:DNA-binding MarR family transcriptional regulator